MPQDRAIRPKDDVFKCPRNSDFRYAVTGHVGNRWRTTVSRPARNRYWTPFDRSIMFEHVYVAPGDHDDFGVWVVVEIGNGGKAVRHRRIPIQGTVRVVSAASCDNIRGTIQVYVRDKT
jgi:hypothetical protein